MKKLITILVLSSAMLSACEGDPEFVPKTSVEEIGGENPRTDDRLRWKNRYGRIHSGRTAGCLAD